MTADAELNENTGADAPEQVEPGFKSLEEAVAAHNALKADHDKALKNLEQSRKEETFNKTERKRLEKELAAALKSDGLSDLQAKLEAAEARANALEQKANNKLIDDALTKALTDAKAKAVSTVMKLINRGDIKVGDDGVVDTKSIEAQIATLQKEDPFLFEAVETPSVKRGAEGAVVGGYEKEVAAAKSIQDLEAVMRKYGKA